MSFKVGDFALGLGKSQPTSSGEAAAPPVEQTAGPSVSEGSAQGGSIAGFAQISRSLRSRARRCSRTPRCWPCFPSVVRHTTPASGSLRCRARGMCGGRARQLFRAAGLRFRGHAACARTGGRRLRPCADQWGLSNCICPICLFSPRCSRWRSTGLRCRVRRCSSRCPGARSRSVPAALQSAVA